MFDCLPALPTSGIGTACDHKSSCNTSQGFNFMTGYLSNVNTLFQPCYCLQQVQAAPYGNPDIAHSNLHFGVIIYIHNIYYPEVASRESKSSGCMSIYLFLFKYQRPRCCPRLSLHFIFRVNIYIYISTYIYMPLTNNVEFYW